MTFEQMTTKLEKVAEQTNKAIGIAKLRANSGGDLEGLFMAVGSSLMFGVVKDYLEEAVNEDKDTESACVGDGGVSGATV